MSQKVRKRVSLLLTLLLMMNLLPISAFASTLEVNHISLLEEGDQGHLVVQDEHYEENNVEQGEAVLLPKPVVTYGPYQAGEEPPNRAHEPFLGLEQKQESELTGLADFHPDRINVKLKTSLPPPGSFAPLDVGLDFAAHGVIDLEPLFPAHDCS